MRVNLFILALVPGAVALALAVSTLAMMLALGNLLGSAASDGSGTWTALVGVQSATALAGCIACAVLASAVRAAAPPARWAHLAIWALAVGALVLVIFSAQTLSLREVALTMGAQVTFAAIAVAALVWHRQVAAR